MKEVFIVADNITSPIGRTTAENFEQLKNGASGIKEHHDKALADGPFCASLFDENSFVDASVNNHTRFEQLLIASINDVLNTSGLDAGDGQTVLIISSTKGNISLLETEPDTPGLQQRIALPTSARLVAHHFGFVNPPVVISNACISGIMAIITGMRLIQSGQYQTRLLPAQTSLPNLCYLGFNPSRPSAQNPANLLI